MKNEIILDLRIFDFNDITHDELTMLIGLKPVKIHIKGDKKYPEKLNSPLIEKNNWFLGSGLDKHSSFDEQMNAMLDIIESKKDVFRSICKKYYCEFRCATTIYYGNKESVPWVYLGERYNAINKELKIAFDLDLYVWSNRTSKKRK